MRHDAIPDYSNTNGAYFYLQMFIPSITLCFIREGRIDWLFYNLRYGQGVKQNNHLI